MRNLLSNATLLNKKVIAYINDIVRNVFRIRSNNIKYFGTDFDAALDKNKKASTAIEEMWGSTRESLLAVINGVDMTRLAIYEAFLKNSKQYKTVVERKHYIFNGRVMGSLASGTTYVVQQFDKKALSIIRAPEGYDGNTSFVEVLVPVEVMDSVGSGSSSELTAFYTLLDSISTRNANKDALLYYSSQVTKGSFSINIAKNKESIIVSTDCSGLSDSCFEDKADPYFLVRTTFYRRGYE